MKISDSIIAFLGNVFNNVGQIIQVALNREVNEIRLAYNFQNSLLAIIYNTTGNVYNSIAQSVPGAIKNVMMVTSDRYSGIIKGLNNTISQTKNNIANLTFSIGVKLENVSHIAGITIIKFGYLFVPEPTKIYDVQVVVLSSTSAKISWKTNHPANGKVNYGLDETYPMDIQTEKRTNDHEFLLTNLSPDTEYHFEVMSQNRNYVYDANRKIKTFTE